MTAGDLLSFSVNFRDICITSWTAHGVVDHGATKILSLWQMVVAVPDETDPDVQWTTVYAGADEFTPNQALKRKQQESVRTRQLADNFADIWWTTPKRFRDASSSDAPSIP